MKRESGTLWEGDRERKNQRKRKGEKEKEKKKRERGKVRQGDKKDRKQQREKKKMISLFLPSSFLSFFAIKKLWRFSGKKKEKKYIIFLRKYEI